MEAIPLLSGLDLARGLMRLGHRMVGNANGYLLMERGPRAVTIPLLDEVTPSLLSFLLRGAGVTVSQLVTALRPETLERRPARAARRTPGGRADVPPLGRIDEFQSL